MSGCAPQINTRLRGSLHSAHAMQSTGCVAVVSFYLQHGQHCGGELVDGSVQSHHGCQGIIPPCEREDSPLGEPCTVAVALADAVAAQCVCHLVLSLIQPSQVEGGSRVLRGSHQLLSCSPVACGAVDAQHCQLVACKAHSVLQGRTGLGWLTFWRVAPHGDTSDVLAAHKRSTQAQPTPACVQHVKAATPALW